MIGADASRGESPRTPSRGLTRAFERALWQSRLVVLVAVVASVLLAVCMLYVTTVDVINWPWGPC